MKRTIVNIPIYFGKIHIIVTTSFSDANSKYKLKIPSSYLEGSYEGLTGRIKCKDNIDTYFILLSPKATSSIIVHESVHLTNFIFKDTCVELDINNDESQAYLTAFVFDKINNVISKYNKNDTCISTYC